MKYLKISEFAKAAEIKTTTIRYYERIGIFPKPDVSESGYRQYTENFIKTAQFIRRAKNIGFSLKEISELLLLRTNKSKSCNYIKTMVETKITDINEKIIFLEHLREKLLMMEKLCENERNKDSCPIMDILEDK